MLSAWSAFMARSESEKSIRRAARRDLLIGWCGEADRIISKMPHGTPQLSYKARYRLACRLKDATHKAQMGFECDFAPSEAAIKRRIDGIRQSIRRIAQFSADRANEAPISAIAVAANQWRKRQRGKLDDWHFEAPIKSAEGYTDFRGYSFVLRWLGSAAIMMEILNEEDFGTSVIRELNWPNEITVLQGSTLPKLFERTYPTLHFGGKVADRPEGAGYAFVVAAMEVLGFNAPANETIRSARKKMAEFRG
jgi:hypothetical protein